MKEFTKVFVVVLLVVGSLQTHSFAQTPYPIPRPINIGGCLPYITDLFQSNYYSYPRTPDWRAPYAPKQYRPCSWHDGLNTDYIIGGYMKWDGWSRSWVQWHASYGRRYTHDITDPNRNFGHNAYWTSNFPNGKFDWDSDLGDVIPLDYMREETEITVDDPGFPVIDREYYFFVWMRRGGMFGNGFNPVYGEYGNVHTTPAISRPAHWWEILADGDKWNTYEYTRWPWKDGYPCFCGRPESGDIETEKKTGRMGQEIPEAEQSKTVDLDAPISVEELEARLRNDISRPLSGFTLQYVIETKSGEKEIMLVGGRPTESEFVSLAEIDEMLLTLPHFSKTLHINGVVSYELGPSKQAETN